MTYNSSEKYSNIIQILFATNEESSFFEKSLCGTNDIKKERRCK